ncbi:MAG: AMP-binding protein [Acidimicrobiales bacterium]
MSVNLASIIDPHPADAPALISRGKVTSYGELRRQVGELRAGLLERGVAPGDRVALLSANNWFFAVSYLAVLGVGAVAVPLNPSSPPAELSAQLAAVGATLTLSGPAVDVAGAVPIETAFASSEAAMVARDASDLAALLFTAGTAGAPKAAMLSHGNLLANLDQIQAHPGRAITSADVGLGVLPMHHIFGLNVVLGLTLRAGGSVVLVERFDPSSALETIANHKVTIVAGAPPMFTSWLALPAGPDDEMTSVRLAVSGAASLPAAVTGAFHERFGVAIHEGYGLTEASPTVTSSVVGGQVKPGSIGVPVDGVEVRLVDVDGEDVYAGDPGEIWVRGPNVFQGYWERPDATAAALTADGWLRTGDVAVVDDEGWLFIVDRVKDLINVSGFNVFPAEVEDALREHPGVAEVAVVGVAHPHTGEAVKAFVVPTPGHHVEEDELIDFCATRLARYKCPSKVMFVDALPHSPATGKLLRRALR